MVKVILILLFPVMLFAQPFFPRHQGLYDMPDYGGVNRDHDRRYVIEPAMLGDAPSSGEVLLHDGTNWIPSNFPVDCDTMGTDSGGILVCKVVATTTTTMPAYLLLESGDNLLLESGDDLQLE